MPPHRLGDPDEQARAHRRLAVASADLGRYDDAHLHLDRALDLSGGIGDLGRQAWTHYLDNLVAFLQGRTAEALDAAQQALRHTAGDPDTASAAWQQARDILGDLGRPAAGQVVAQLHHLGQPAAGDAFATAESVCT